jgi:ATP-dependent Clp protease protease subunit
LKNFKIKKINSTYLNYYKNSLNYNYGGDQQVDVFTKLFEDRILMLTGDVDDYICDLVKAQLLYLESESKEDITMYINSGGGSVYSGLGLLDVMDFVKPDIITVNTDLHLWQQLFFVLVQMVKKALKRSRTMIHQPMSYGSGYSQASDMD